MPPKIMYGKKKTTSRPKTSFSKFISPEKDRMLAGTGAESAVSVARQEQQQFQDATNQEHNLDALEQGLEGLRLDVEQTQIAEDVVETKNKKGRLRTARPKLDATDINESNNDKLDEADMKAGAVESRVGDAQVEVPVRRKKDGPRKALHNRDANETTNVDPQLLHTHVRKQREAFTQYAADIRLRTAVQTQPTRGKSKSKPSSSRQVQLPTPEATPEPDEIHSFYVSPLLSLSDRRKVVSFEQWSGELEPHFNITKIAEASFSEVYRLSATSASTVGAQESVLKVVALKTPPSVPLPCQSQSRVVRGGEGQVARDIAQREENDMWKSDVADVLSEVKLLQNLNHIPGFTNFRDLTILQGQPPPSFCSAWKAWNKTRPRGKKSEFPDPNKKASYDDTQLWAVIEMQDAGTDCEKLMETDSLSSIWDVWDVFWGVCLSVAKAEETCRFEHRDLHMGNICVRSSRPDGNVLEPVIQDPLRRKFRFTGLETTVIDYTLSRADVLASPSRRSSSSTVSTNLSLSSTFDAPELDVAYLDLNKDLALFEGDASEEYQYEIYRYMRGAALYNNPLQHTATVEAPKTPRRSPRKNIHLRFDEDEDDRQRRSPQKVTSTSTTTETQPENIWRDFHPKTNLVWTHFLLHKLLTHLDQHAKTPDQLSTKQIMANMEDIEDVEPLKVKKKAVKLYAVLKRVSELLCPVMLGRGNSLGSVKELVVLALEERWLRVGDVAG
jgi:serine/threonine-protein kinase haspin